VIDRRHLVLGVAVAATIAHKRVEPYLFEGDETLDVANLRVPGHESRSWMVTAEVELPGVAETSTFGSVFAVYAYVRPSDAKPQKLSVLARGCDDGVALTELVLPDDQDTGGYMAALVEIQDPFAECQPRQACARTLCLDASNHGATRVELTLQIYAGVSTDEYADEEADTIEVPITITFEEAEP
jgi:hypothetical protein